MMTELHFLEQAADRLRDALAEYTPPFSPPETWGPEWELDRWELGPDPDQPPEDLDRYLIDPELAHWIAYGNCRD